MLDRTEKLFTPEAAEKAAADMQRGDEDWTYVVRHCPKGTGYSFIEIWDECGEMIGKV